MATFWTDRIDEVLGWVVPDPDACRKLAQQVRERNPAASPEELAKELVAFAKKQGATVGGVTGIAASPFTFMPAAVADMAAMLKIEGTMAGGIAALLDPASLDDPTRFRADVLAIVFPSAVSQAMRQLGIRAGEQLTKNLVRRAVSHSGFEALSKLAGRFLGVRLAGRAVASKGVPLVGAGIGAGWNWFEVQAMGTRAIAYHSGQPVASRRLRDWGRKLLPSKVRSLLPQRQEPQPPPLPTSAAQPNPGGK